MDLLKMEGMIFDDNVGYLSDIYEVLDFLYILFYICNFYSFGNDIIFFLQIENIRFREVK